MFIKEGATVTILSFGDVVIDKIKTSEDILFEGNGEGYIFLLRHEGSEENCVFESDVIYEKDNEYFVEGAFKDAILVVQDKKEKTMHESYMDYDN